MKKILKKGKSIVALITVFAILAASVFTGIVAGAESQYCGGTIVEKWDQYSDGAWSEWYDSTYEGGDGTKDNPYIISSAEELANLCRYGSDANVYYKVADEIRAFDMNTVSGVDLTADNIAAQEVKDSVNDKILGKVWVCDSAFKGNFDGNGVTIYGLYAGQAYYNQASFESGSKAGCSRAGLFPIIDAKTAVIKNITIKNSYFKGDPAGAVFGETLENGGSATVENIVVANCYIESTGGYNSGAIGGYCKYKAETNTADKAKINNCLVYDNIVYNKTGTPARLIGTMEAYCDDGNGTKVRDYNGFGVSNTIAIGCGIENTSSWWQKDSAFYSNCYTTETPAAENATIMKIAAADAVGNNAITNLKNLDKSSWFFNTTTYPQLRVFHDIKSKNNGDGTHSEVCTCGLESVPSVHTFISGICSACGFIDPCINGHTLESIAEVPATKTENGTKAHDHCTVCDKLFIDGTMVLANDLVIPMLITTSTFTGNLDNELIGSGTKKDPYLITSADELAAVALGKFQSTDATYFKVLESITAFYMNGGEEVAAMSNANDVKAYFEANGGKDWNAVNTFAGQFDGSGATVYGLYCKNTGQYDQSALFPKVAGHSAIKNISVKNSYISGFSKDGAIAALVGGTIWKGDNNADTSVTAENIVVANNYIASTNDTVIFGASVLMGNFYDKHYVDINNCLIYGNIVENAYKGSGLKSGMITSCNGVVPNLKFNNIIALGVTPWTIADNGNGTYSHAGWYMSNVDSGQFTNIYTDQSKDILQAYNPTNNRDTMLNAFNIKTSMTAEQLIGAAAKENITTLDESIWFFNTTTYPQIRVFHEITADSLGADGHENERDVCCGLEIIGKGIIPHSYVGHTCSICGYTFPCAYGHNFTDVPAKDASYEEAGNIAHKYCSQCDKKYPMDAAIDEPITSAYTDSDVIIPQMLPYDEWDGTLASYFWMNNEGDGSPGNPFIIHSAEQLAAVATGNLKYDANKPMSTQFDVNKYTITGGILDTNDLTFKIRDGLNYLYINGGEAVAKLDNAEDVKDYFESNAAYNWPSGSKFSGTFNGNGAEIYGVYGTNKDSVALFPIVDSKTSIKNVVLKNSYFKSNEGSQNSIAAAGLIGRAQWYADSTLFATISVRSCVVANNYICSQGKDKDTSRAGAIAGVLFSNNISLRDTLVYGNILVNGSSIPQEYKAGLVSYASGGSTIFKNIVSIDTPPYTMGGGWHLYDNSKFTNVYTDCPITIDDGAAQNYKNITKLTKKEMTGEKAAENMPELDWVQFWITNDGEYPTPRIVNIKDYSSGLAWTGEIAKEFPSGDGSKSNPYVIPAPEYLALMLNSENKGLYYKLTADIIINDTSVQDWQANAKQWFTSDTVANFKGNLDGNGYTVSGIYYDNLDAGVSGGIIPVADSTSVSNLTVKDSYISTNNNSFVGAVIGSVIDSSEKPISLQGITIEDSVIVQGETSVGGIIGKAGESIVRISNSISKSGGFIGSASNGVSIKNSVAVNYSPVGALNGAQFKNVYSNVDSSFEGVTVLSDDAMKGDAAATNMSGLDFAKFWTTVAGDYPALAGVISSDNGVMGEVWSGNVASDYAGGDGSAENPYLIATAEQLARCVTRHAHSKHYKLIADIYLNDVESPYWDIKVGCNEWYHNQSGASWALFKDGGSFDGDGYVVYGLYYNRTGFNETNNKGAYLGLFPTVGESSTIKNVAISNAYVAGSVHLYIDSEAGIYFSDSAGALVGSFVQWNVSYKADRPSQFDAIEYNKRPEIWNQMPIVENCLVDHTSYISGTYSGGLFGYCDEPFRAYDCIFTGSLKGMQEEHTGGIAGQDTANGAYYYRCVSLPQTCDRPYGGWANANWRINQAQWCTTVVDGYYFSKYIRVNSGEKIANPADRVGEAAKAAMPLLDWENNWMVIDEGTPIQQIFAKNHTVEQYTALSDRAFMAPFVTVSFVTDTDTVTVDDMVGRMYSPITLPTVSREGYTFTGWYVFDDCSIEYPLDYFPPRDLQLFAGWEPTGIIQNFENYTDTIFDYNFDQWRLNKPGVKGGYKNAYVRNGAKSMRLLDANTGEVDSLLNYEDMLKIGQDYKMTFWVATDVANNPDTILKVVHNKLPEYNSENSGVEQIAVVKNLTVGEWTQYSCEFTAKTPWISIRAGGNSSLYFDDFILAAMGADVGYDALAKYLDTLDPSSLGSVITDNGGVSPNTSENVTVATLIAVIISCAVIIIISRKNLVEVIEN